MSLSVVLTDSFDGYTTATQRWSSGLAISVGNGRFGTNALYAAAVTSNFAYTNLPSNYTSVQACIAVKVTENGQLGIIEFREGTDEHVSICIESGTGHYKVFRDGLNGTLLGTGTLSVYMRKDRWTHIEARVTIHESAGVVKLWVDGVLVFDQTGLDTQNGGTGVINNIHLGDTWSSAGMSAYWDDLVVADATSASGNETLGDCRVEALIPNGNGNSSQWVGSDGNSTDNYLLVDEIPPSSTDYVESSTVGNKDTYAFGNLTSTSGTVLAVQKSAFAAKTDAGSRSIALVSRLSGTEVDSSNHSLSTSYAYYSTVEETKPGGGAWSISDVNNAEFGVKVTA